MIHCNNCNANYEYVGQDYKICKYCNQQGYTFITDIYKLLKFIFEQHKFNMQQLEQLSIQNISKKELQEMKNIISNDLDNGNYLDQNFNASGKIYLQEKISKILNKKN